MLPYHNVCLFMKFCLQKCQNLSLELTGSLKNNAKCIMGWTRLHPRSEKTEVLYVTTILTSSRDYGWEKNMFAYTKYVVSCLISVCLVITDLIFALYWPKKYRLTNCRMDKPAHLRTNGPAHWSTDTPFYGVVTKKCLNYRLSHVP